MSARLGDNHYGKNDVRVVKITRGLDRHELRDLTVDVALALGVTEQVTVGSRAAGGPD